MIPYKGTFGFNGKNIEWETTFDSSIKFKCVDCGFSCTNSNVEIDPIEISRIGNMGYSNFAKPSKINGKTIFHIIGSENSVCMFRSDGKCKIHAIKPYVCSLYPFKIIAYSQTKVYIDLIHACTSVLDENTSENEINFESYVRHFLEFSSAVYIENNHQKITNKLEDEVVFFTLWHSLCLTLPRARNLSHLCLIANQMQKILSAKKYSVFSREVLSEIIGNSLGSAFSHDLSSYADVKFGNNYDIKYDSLEWISKKQFTITFNNHNVIIEKLDAKIELEIAKIKEHDLDHDSKIFLQKYLLRVWDRQTFKFNFYSSFLGQNISSTLYHLQIAQKKLNLFQFLLDIIATGKKHDRISLNDCKEAILIMDLIFLQV